MKDKRLFVFYLPLYNLCSTFKPKLFHMVFQLKKKKSLYYSSATANWISKAG